MESYVEAFQATGIERYRQVVKDVAHYLMRDMKDPLGGFHSTEDADSEGVEGKFYVWNPDEILDLLCERGERFCQVYNVTKAGNFEGNNILHLKKAVPEMANEVGLNANELAECRHILFKHRETRVRPGKDDKILTNWNGLAIQALAKAAMALNESRLLDSAIEAANFVGQYLTTDNGQLLHTYREGKSHVAGFLDDYAYMVQAYVTLYEATFDETWITQARQLADVIMNDFHDDEAGSFFYTAAGQGDLISRTKEIQDASVPSSNAMTATALTRLGWLTGKTEYLDAARRTIENTAPLLQKMPAAFGQMLIAAHMWLQPFWQWVFVGELDSHQDIIAKLQAKFLPSVVIAARDANVESPGPLDDLFTDRAAVNGELTLYRCTHFQCDAPIVGREAVLEVIS